MCLRISHPLIPCLSQELWSRYHLSSKDEMDLVSVPYPTSTILAPFRDEQASDEMEVCLSPCSLLYLFTSKADNLLTVPSLCCCFSSTRDDRIRLYMIFNCIPYTARKLGMRGWCFFCRISPFSFRFDVFPVELVFFPQFFTKALRTVRHVRQTNTGFVDEQSVRIDCTPRRSLVLTEYREHFERLGRLKNISLESSEQPSPPHRGYAVELVEPSCFVAMPIEPSRVSAHISKLEDQV